MAKSNYHRDYQEKNRDRLRIYNATRHMNMRNAAHAALGGACVVCGFSDSRALQIDHINGDGAREKMSKGSECYYKMVVNSVAKGENKFQLLCANHNWIKRVEKGEVKAVRALANM